MNEAHCGLCGESYKAGEKVCECWKCMGCGEEFSDYDMLANREKWLCHYCENLREEVEDVRNPNQSR